MPESGLARIHLGTVSAGEVAWCPSYITCTESELLILQVVGEDTRLDQIWQKSEIHWAEEGFWRDFLLKQAMAAMAAASLNTLTFAIAVTLETLGYASLPVECLTNTVVTSESVNLAKTWCTCCCVLASHCSGSRLTTVYCIVVKKSFVRELSTSRAWCSRPITQWFPNTYLLMSLNLCRIGVPHAYPTICTCSSFGLHCFSIVHGSSGGSALSLDIAKS